MTTPEHPARRLGALKLLGGFLLVAILVAWIFKPPRCDSLACILRLSPPRDSDTLYVVPADTARWP